MVGGISPVLATAAHQVVTRRWWEKRRHDYRLHVSSLVEEELAEGDASYAQQRLALVADVARLVITAEVARLADYFFAYLRLPQAAAPDAMHPHDLHTGRTLRLGGRDMIDEDEIVAEIHAVRKKIWEECGCDFQKLGERLMRLQEQHPERLVYEVSKTTEPEPTASSGGR